MHTIRQRQTLRSELLGNTITRATDVRRAHWIDRHPIRAMVLIVALTLIIGALVWLMAWPRKAHGQGTNWPEAREPVVCESPRWVPAEQVDGKLSTPEQDCLIDGLVMAPWGVFLSGMGTLVVWCVSPDLVKIISSCQPPEWVAPPPERADSYCQSWRHGRLTRLDMDGRFWCDGRPGRDA